MRDGDIYANHIAPLDGYNVAGILWYQGENDAAEQEPALQYEANFSTLINQYREVLGDSDLPFLYVQLARYTGYAYTPIVRQAQFSVLHSAAVNTTRNLAMTVSMDTDKGTAKIIHPLGKEILAKRMADQWLAIEGQTTITVRSSGIIRRTGRRRRFHSIRQFQHGNGAWSTGFGTESYAESHHVDSYIVYGASLCRVLRSQESMECSTPHPLTYKEIL